MLFRKIQHANFDSLVTWLIQNDVRYDTKTRNGVVYLGLQPHIWKKIDFGFAVG